MSSEFQILSQLVHKPTYSLFCSSCDFILITQSCIKVFFYMYKYPRIDNNQFIYFFFFLASTNSILLLV